MFVVVSYNAEVLLFWWCYYTIFTASKYYFYNVILLFLWCRDECLFYRVRIDMYLCSDNLQTNRYIFYVVTPILSIVLTPKTDTHGYIYRLWFILVHVCSSISLTGYTRMVYVNHNMTWKHIERCTNMVQGKWLTAIFTLYFCSGLLR